MNELCAARKMPLRFVGIKSLFGLKRNGTVFVKNTYDKTKKAVKAYIYGHPQKRPKFFPLDTIVYSSNLPF